MKKIIVQNDTSATIVIVTEETTYRVETEEKISIQTEGKRVYVKKASAPKANVKLGLQHDFTTYVSPSWGFRPIFVNTFASYFYVDDVYKFVSITEHCYLAGAASIAIFNMYKVHSANREVQKVEFYRKSDRKKYKSFHLLSIIPLFVITGLFSLVAIYGIVTDFDGYILLFGILLALFWCLLIKVYKEQKAFYYIEKNPEAIMNNVEEVKIDYMKNFYIKYRVLTKKY